MSATEQQARALMPGLAGDPQIVVILPVYGHPVLLSEAIESVLAQQCVQCIAIVVISDGCRLAETHLVASSYAIAHPNVIYLRKGNGGPSSARNYGIQFALRTWPTMEAVYFLDSDNHLTPTAISDAYLALSSDRDLGWVYPHIDSFGITWSANYSVPYSPLLHVIYDNMCDTGSLVSRAVLESGVRFDEDARSGYEDWDFWLQCVDKGFRGRHTPFGFTYRQRPESRFREMNRKRGAMVEYLRNRHWASASPRNLLRWEHVDNSRFLFTDARGSSAFTDPACPSDVMPRTAVVEKIFAGIRQPDENLLWPFFAFGDRAALDWLAARGLVHGVFSLMEREAERTHFVAVTFEACESEISLHIRPFEYLKDVSDRAVLWMCRAQQITEVVANSGNNWEAALICKALAPGNAEIVVCAPGKVLDCAQIGSSVDILLGLVRDLRASPYARQVVERWTWRPQHFPPRCEYYQYLRRYIGVDLMTCRLSGKRLEVGVVVPVASFGGAEKVAYAMARHLRQLGCRLHLFVFGKPVLKVLSEFSEAFDTISFLAQPEFPIWGGSLMVYGQECFPSDSPELKSSGVTGLLSGLDLLVNCHVQPLNSIMGTFRSQERAKTATYLHVFDSTPQGRPVGHPYLAVAFEHAYDCVLTCSRQLADDIHGLGVPTEKIVSIANGPGFTAVPKAVEAAVVWRGLARGDRPLRLLYIGRLDPQKGIERILEAARGFQYEDLDVILRVVGAGLMSEGRNWAADLVEVGATVEPPLFSSADLTEVYAWADVLLLPSRWEGAPLVIPECQQLGCVPLATRVGAVDELIQDHVDGLLVESNEDDRVAAAIVEKVAWLLADDSRRHSLALGALRRASINSWERNFEPLSRWIEAAFPDHFPPALSPGLGDQAS
jgi:glycosyltransferase involved in cell wall biosynthesis